MKKRSDMITNLFFRLLPVQILLLAIGSINSVIDGVMASNFIGTDAMTVTGLYMMMNPLRMPGCMSTWRARDVFWT